MYAALQSFIQLSLTVTELCHVMCDHSKEFYTSQRIYYKRLLYLTINRGLYTQITGYYSFWNS